MNAFQSQRIRFGILAARHMLERDRLTAGQVDDLEGCKGSGWLVKDSQDAFDREFESATERLLDLKSRAALRAHGSKALALRKRWLRAR